MEIITLKFYIEYRFLWYRRHDQALSEYNEQENNLEKDNRQQETTISNRRSNKKRNKLSK